MSSKDSIFSDNLKLSYGKCNKFQLYNRTKSSLDFVRRLKLESKLEVHNGCVNSICWNDSGTCILSGSDDQHLNITDPFTKKPVVALHSGHRANIFSAKFLPNTNDKQIISCSGDGMIYFTEVERDDTHSYNSFDCHFGTAYEVLTVPQDSYTFLSCGEDGTVRWFDLRIKDKCSKEDCKEDILINCRRSVTAITINPLLPYQLAVGCSDSSVRIFDRRMLGTRATGNYLGRGITGLMCRFTAPLLEKRAHRITSLAYSPDSQAVLVSYSSEHLYLFELKANGKKLEFKKESSATPETSKDVSGDPVKPVTRTETKSVSPVEEKVIEENKIPAEPVAGPSNQADGKSDSGDSKPEEGGRHPPVKRLRLRGDWSDTGPNARPERERGEQDRANVTIMQRMSDMLTRWLEGAARQASGAEGEQEGEQGAEQGGEQPGEQAEATTHQEGTSQANDEASSQAEIMTAVELKVPNLPQKGDGTDIPEDNTGKADTKEVSPATLTTQALPKADKQAAKDALFKAQVAQVQNLASQLVCDKLSSSDEVNETQDASSKTPATLKPVVDNTKSDTDKEAKDTSGNIKPKPKADISQAESSSSEGTIDAQAVEHTAHRLDSLGSDVVSIRQTIQREGLDPVISFDYRSEGTSASTISVDLTSRTSAHSSYSQREPATASARLNSPSTSDSQNSNTVQTTSVSKPLESQHKDDKSDHLKNSNLPGSKHAKMDIQEKERQESMSSCNKSSQDDVSNINPSDNNLSSQNNSQPQAPVDENICDKAGKTQACDKKPAILKVPNIRPSTSKEDSITDVKSKDTESQEKSLSDNHNVCESNNEQSGPLMETSMSQNTKNVTNEPSTSHAHGETTGGARPKLSTGSEESDKNEKETEEDTTSRGEETEEDQPPRRKSQSREASLGSSRTTGISSSTRQRRYGHSGPPTGDFQLHSSSDHDDDDDDSDSELMRAKERSRRRWGDRDENMAARRLQWLYRKRQEEREKEESELKAVFQPTMKKVYKGHRNARTMIKEANFWGDNFVMSGSDCGHIFVYDRHSTDLVMLLEADRHVVNCIQPHPFDPVLASSGIDYDIKVWMPSNSEPQFDSERAEEVMRRNQIMLEETRDTITVPASFMLRMLASLNHIRSVSVGGNQQGSGNSSSSSSDES